MDNPDLDWGTNDPQPEAQEQQPVVETPQVAVQEPEPVQADADMETLKAEAFRALRETERARAEAMAREAYMAGLQAAQQQAPQYQQQEEETEPDPVLDPRGYATWVREQVKRELMPQVQQNQHQTAAVMYQQSLNMARQMRPDFDELLQAANGLASKFPSIVNDVQTSDNPGLRIIELGEMALGRKGSPAQAAIPDHVRQQVLAEEAAKRAKAGTQPQFQTPRGVGGVPAGAGMNDLTPPPQQWQQLARSNPGQWEQIKDSILNSNGGAL